MKKFKKLPISKDFAKKKITFHKTDFSEPLEVTISAVKTSNKEWTLFGSADIFLTLYLYMDNMNTFINNQKIDIKKIVNCDDEVFKLCKYKPNK